MSCCTATTLFWCSFYLVFAVISVCCSCSVLQLQCVAVISVWCSFCRVCAQHDIMLHCNCNTLQLLHTDITATHCNCNTLTSPQHRLQILGNTIGGGGMCPATATHWFCCNTLTSLQHTDITATNCNCNTLISQQIPKKMNSFRQDDLQIFWLC